MIPLRKKNPIRSYSGEKWRTNRSNKEKLDIDFHSCCAYCDDHHRYSGGYNSYHVEHFAPKKQFPSLEFIYENLLYACPFCNISKSNKWPSDHSNINVVIDEGFINPCNEEYDSHLYRQNNGAIAHRTELGKYMYKELKLYLTRHRLINIIDRLSTAIPKLKSKIVEMNKNGENTDYIMKSYNKALELYFYHSEEFHCYND